MLIDRHFRHRFAVITIVVVSLLTLASTPAAADTYCISVNDRTVACI